MTNTAPRSSGSAGDYTLRREFGINPILAIHVSLFVVELILTTLILADWRMGERRRRAYPIALATHVVVQLLMAPVPASAPWLAFCRWFAAGPMSA